MRWVEANFDGLVGPTHNYAGLSYGNVASMTNVGAVARPRQAARQGLAKMRFVASLGVPQGVLPPHERPFIPALRRLGFDGPDAHVVEEVSKRDRVLLAQVSTASAMWAANAATVAPSSDTRDGKVHFVPANLVSTFHRSLEAEQTTRALRRVFADARHFVVHDPLPACATFADEGAANHTRFAFAPSGSSARPRAAHLFVYGRSPSGASSIAPSRFPARQTLEASRAVARLLALDASSVVFTQQSPGAIDAGVFHNDVVSVGSGDAWLYHERAFIDEVGAVTQVSRALGHDVVRLRVSSSELDLEETVRSYLFNSQLLVAPSGARVLVAPRESEESVASRRVVDRLLAAGALDAVHYLDVRESMRNGGGPACLRLRVPLTDTERAATASRVWLDDALATELERWIDAHYREELAPHDLADPALLDETRRALDALTTLLGLGKDFYPFQRTGAAHA